MFRPIPYSILFIIVVLSQILIFDKLMLSTFLVPLIYISYILLLPMQTNQFVMLMWGCFVGVIMDIATGMPGVNTIPTLLVAFLRIHILSQIGGREVILNGAPTPQVLGLRRFELYLLIMILIHSATLLTIEFANFSQIGFLLRRIVFSSAFSILFVWLIAGRFQQLLSRKF